MVDDELLSREVLGDAEWSITPRPEDLVPDSIARERERDPFREALLDDPPAVVLTHGDADGLTSAALLVEVEGSDTVVQPVSYHGAYQFEHALEDLHDSRLRDTPIYICDFNLDSTHPLDLLADLIQNQNCPITWFDHHQWPDVIVDELEDIGVELYIDTDECTASLIQYRAWDAFEWDWEDQIEDLVAVTKDRDLWINEDSRSSRLAVFAEIAEPREYVYTVLNVGADFPDDVEDRIEQRQEELEVLEDLAVERAVQTDVGDFSVAWTYSADGRSSEIGNRLTEQGDADIALVAKAHGGLGIYSHSNRETFARCHEIASELGGGGHPTAAGCELDFGAFRDLAYYWQTKGDCARSDGLEAVRSVVLQEADHNE